MQDDQFPRTRMPISGREAHGPSQAYVLSVDLSHGPTDEHRRLAYLVCDNAVELSMKVYLGLHKKKLGSTVQQPNHDSFADLARVLDGCSHGRVDISFDELLSLHETRNTLYHRGNGITANASELAEYLDVARRMVTALFGETAIPDAMRALSSYPTEPPPPSDEPYPTEIRELATLVANVRKRAAASGPDRPAAALLRPTDFETIGDATRFIVEAAAEYHTGIDTAVDDWVQSVNESMIDLEIFFSDGSAESHEDLIDALEHLHSLAISLAA